MATTVYGSTVNHWRAYMTYTAGSTNNDTTYAVNVSAAGIQSVSWGFGIDYVDCTLEATGQTTKSVTNQSFTSASGSTTSKSYLSGTFSWTKGHSAATKTIKVTTKNHSGYMDGTSSKSVTVTVPAKTSYTVSYNANGGSGAPSAQTKWYGESLTLSTTKPTRTGYNFLGWSTSSTATTATYAAGATYTSNSALSLHAVWKKSYVAPTISAGTAYRCGSDGVAEDEGNYVAGKVTWSVDTTQTSGNLGDTLLVEYYNPSTSAYTALATIDLSASSGTTSYGPLQPSGGFSTDQSYKIRLTVTDTSSNSGNSATKVVTLSQAFFLMDALAQTSGKALAFGRAATAADAGKVVIGGSLGLALEGEGVTATNGTANTNTYYVAERTDTNKKISFGIGAGGTNRGIWDNSDGAWALYMDANDRLHIPQHAMARHDGTRTSSLSVATGKDTSLCSVTVSEAGMWLLIGHVVFQTVNTSGRRVAGITTSSGGSLSATAGNSVVQQNATNGASTAISVFDVVTCEYGSSFTRYLTCYQNSGSALNCIGSIKAVRIGMPE